MTKPRYVPLPGSERRVPPVAARSNATSAQAPREHTASATVVLRRRSELPDSLVLDQKFISADELAERYGADPADIEKVRSVLERFKVSVVSVDAGSRRVTVEGSVADVERAFDIALHSASGTDPESGRGYEYRYRTGVLSIPAELDGIVTAVLGLDNRRQAETRLRVVPAAAAASSYTPVELGEIYHFPQGATGAGQRLAIIELGGGYTSAGLRQYFTSLGIVPPKVTAVSVGGAKNIPGADPGADGEVQLDIEIAGALAPGAQMLVYFAPNTDEGFLEAVSQAVHAAPAPTAISISWGASEDSWTASARNALNEAFRDAAALGITVTAADSGSSDGVSDRRAHVDFPASSPHVLAAGGTSLRADPTTGAVQSETVWNDSQGSTGGGVSDVFPLPTWQAHVAVPRAGRGVPDVSAVADPATGYQVLVDNQPAVIGGTSAVAPLWAALVARLAESLGHPLGLLQPLIYPRTPGTTEYPGFRDITIGNNGAYKAGKGWDAATGLGVPDGAALLAHLRGLRSAT
jgi:kumamolisin